MVSEFKLLDHLLQRLDEARHVMVLTGAGMSAESGIPTFRDAQSGIWAKYRPEELATPGAFEANPARVWQWYEERRKKVAKASPHAGHAALVELESLVPSLCVVTQNVDGLHQRAGSAPVVEFHGNLFIDRCRDRGCDQAAAATPADELPRCGTCGGLLRPGVVWFGEAIPPQPLQAAFEAASGCDVFLSIGTSSLVYPAAGLIDRAREAGAVTVEINPNPTDHASSNDFALAARAGEALPELVAALAARTN